MKKNRSNILVWIVLINSVIAFMVDAFLGFSHSWVYGVIISLIEIPLIFVVFKMLQGKRWAYIISIIYFILRSFNFNFERFTFYTKNGINLELSFIEQISINLVSLIMLILILIKFQSVPKKTVANNAYKQ